MKKWILGLVCLVSLMALSSDASAFGWRRWCCRSYCAAPCYSAPCYGGSCTTGYRPYYGGYAYSSYRPYSSGYYAGYRSYSGYGSYAATPYVAAPAYTYAAPAYGYAAPTYGYTAYGYSRGVSLGYGGYGIASTGTWGWYRPRHKLTQRMRTGELRGHPPADRRSEVGGLISRGVIGEMAPRFFSLNRHVLSRYDRIASEKSPEECRFLLPRRFSPR